MKVLVVGGSGFIGSHLTDTLMKNGNDVAVADLKTNPKARTFQTDVTDLLELDTVFYRVQPEVVFNMVCLGFEESETNPAKAMLVNSVGTLNVLKASLKYGVKKMVHSSTGTIYGKPEYLPLDEKHPAHPLCVYGVSKLAAEFYCHMMMNRGLNVTILRYSNVLGPNRNFGVIHLFKERTLNGLSLIVFGGRQSNDYVYVGDVVDANLKCVEKGDGETFNIGSGQEVTIMRLARMVQEKYGGKNQIQNQPSRPHDPTWRFRYDTRKAQKMLGWKPTLSFKQILDSISFA